MNKYSRSESHDTLAHRYEDQARIQRTLIRELTSLRDTLGRLEGAFRSLFADEHFTTLLRAEALDAAPAILVSRIIQAKAPKSDGGEIESSARERLRAKKLSPTAQYELARMVPAKQEEAARLMMASGCFISPYARVIVGACEKSQLIKPKARPRTVILKQSSRGAVNREISEMAKQLKELESFGSREVIAVFMSFHYAARLFRNRRIKAYLSKQCPELENIVESSSR